MRRSILTEKVARRGYHLAREYRVDPFALTRAKEIMAIEIETLPQTMTLHATASFLTAPQTNHPSFPVLDDEGRVIGIVDPPTVLRWRRAGWHRKTTLGELFAGNKVVVAYPDEYLEGLADRLMAANVAHLPVVSREDLHLVGYIGWKDLMRTRTKIHAEEKQRIAFYRWHAPPH
jgi:CBS domain-containing protein